MRFFYSGYVARKVVFLISLGLALFRLVVLPVSDPIFLADVESHSSGLYGYLVLALAIALFFTLDSRRNTLPGLITSLLGCGLYFVLALDVWPIVSSGTYLLSALLLLLEGSLIWGRIRGSNGT